MIKIAKNLLRPLNTEYEEKVMQLTEMEKRADAGDATLQFFFLAVLICWLYTRKLAKKELCYTVL